MIQINLLPKEEQVAEPRISLRVPRAGFWVPLVVGVAVFLPLAGMSAMQRARITSLRKDLVVARSEMAALKPQIDRIDRLTAEREQLNLRLAILQGLCRERTLAVETMDKLADEVPDYLWLTKVAESAPNQLTVEGKAFSNLMIADLMMRMEQDSLFQGVNLVVAEKSREAGGSARPVLAFTLNAQVKP